MSSLFTVSARRCRRRVVRVALAALALAVPVALVPAGAQAVLIVSSIRTPTSGGALAVGTPLVIAGDSSGSEGNAIDSIQVSVDGGATWLEATGTTRWSLTYTPTEPGLLSILSRGNSEGETRVSGQAPVQLTVGAAVPPPPVSCPCQLRLPDVAGSPRIADPDRSPVEVGLRFQLDRDGVITGVRVWRAGYTDGITAHLWGPDQSLLASSAPVGTRMDGAPADIPFAAPVPVQAGLTYIASYFTAAGHYASSELYFGGAMVEPPFSTVFDELGGGGIYQYSDQPAAPSQGWNRSNYWVTPIFTS